VYRTTVDPSILLNVSRSVPFCCVEKLGYSRKVTRMEDGIRKVLGGKSGSVTRSSLAQSDSRNPAWICSFQQGELQIRLGRYAMFVACHFKH